MTFNFGSIQPSTGTLKKRLAGEEIDGASAGDPGERRIEIALVIHRQNHWPVLNDPLGMNDTKTEKHPGDQSGQVIDRKIPRDSPGLIVSAL